jgi:uncharacterized protein (DUF58 family)
MATEAIWGPIAVRARNLAAGLRREGGGQVARSFVRALLMLGLSLVAALYSNSSARDGRVLAAGVAALVAMAIAIWVAVRLVPKLAAGVDWQWLPIFTKYRLTLEGGIYIASTVVVTTAALNTSNNLLYMVLAAMLSVMLLSGFLSGLNLKFLEARARVPDRCYAGQPFTLSVGLRNRKKLFPSLSLEISPDEQSPFSFEPAYISLVRPESLESESVTATLPVRGRWKVGKFLLRSRYPFGFLTKGRTFDVDAEVVAFPELLPMDSVRMAFPDILGTTERFVRGNGMDLYGIREYVSTDSARHVDWKSSARTANLKTREYAAEDSRQILIEFDRFGKPGTNAAFERLVSEAASTAVYLVRDGAEVTLVSDDWVSPMARTEAQVEAILLYLAEVAPKLDAPPPAGWGGDVVRFSLRNRGRGPAADRDAADIRRHGMA